MGGRRRPATAGCCSPCATAGCTHLWALGDDEGPLLAGAGRVVAGLSVVGGTAVVALGTPTSYGEVVALDLATGAETVLTDHGSSLGDIELFEPEERTFTISDGTEVQAWLLRDPERTGPRPLLLDVHGGPHNAWNAAADELHPYHQELVSRGWAVLLVNPRGSDGYGEAFFDGVNGAWGVADHLDFLEPLDALVAEGVADRRPAGGHRLQLRRLHDLLADRPRRPVRGRRRGRGGQRLGQHVRHQRRRPLHERLRARRPAVGAGRGVRRDVAADARRPGEHADARAARRATT